MSRITFIDTTVLCNLVPVPGRDQHREEVRAELIERLERSENFILPITAVIETGNFIAQIKDGTIRRTTAQKFADLLRLVCEGKAPWVLHDIAWNRAFLEAFLDGGETQISFVQHAENRLGAGDLCILTERHHYSRRTGIPASIWSRDGGLIAYNV